MAIIQGSAKSSARGFYPLTIDQSLRFNDDDSAYLSWTPASAGNRKTWTWSGWVKRCALNASAHTFGITAANGGLSTSQRTLMEFDDSTQTITIGFNNGSGWNQCTTDAVFRDVSAWYHIVVAVDMTQATSTDRLKLYVNGVLQSFSSYNVFAQNTDLPVNSTIPHSIGRYQSSGGNNLDGYLAEVHFTDGTAYDADAFGELKSGVWVAKAPSVTYGTNGFYLDFANSADIGNDVSGNANDWTPNNFTAYDVVPDSPTLNFPTFNPIFKTSTGVIAWINNSVTLSQGNLRADLNTGNEVQSGAVSTFALPTSGKFYWEILAIAEASGSISGTGVIEPSTGNYVRTASNTPSRTYGAGDIINIAFDADNSRIYFGINGTFASDQTPTDPADGTSATGSDYLPYVWGNHAGSSNQFAANFGQDSSFFGQKASGSANAQDANGIGDFYYAPPTGYLALSTANLPDPVIDPAQDESPADHFGTLLWTGNTDTGTRTITDATSGVTGEVNFTPDWVWTKSRSATGSHALFDVVRGANKYLTSNGTGAEITNPSSGYLDSFTDGGFVAQEGSSNFANLNTNGTTYVAWNWKANGSGVSNTDGSITSTVSANTTSGFSIVTATYTGAGSSQTFGHGLGTTPAMVIIKDRDASASWGVWHQSYGSYSGNTQILLLNGTNALFASGNYMGTMNSTVAGVSAGLVGNNNQFIAYVFAEVEGFSKFGSYTGNGSSDGTFVYTGFRPAFLMIKRTDTTSNWAMFDTARDTINAGGRELFANLSNAEQSNSLDWDFVSNGFKFRRNYTDNNSSGTYIYMAFAENPFKYSNAR